MHRNNIFIILHRNYKNKTLFILIVFKIMKLDDQFQVQLISKLPHLSKKPFQTGKSRNCSLKKIFLNNNHNTSLSSNNFSQLPKLRHRSKHKQIQNKKNYDSLLEKNQKKQYLLNNKLKKRQKFHTQGQTIQSLAQIQDSFTSLTRKIIFDEQDQKQTMIEFRKKIQQNKLIIKGQIQKKHKQIQKENKLMQKKNKQIHSLAKRQKSFIKKNRVNSQKIIQLPPSNQIMLSKKTKQTPLNKSKFQISTIKERSSSKNIKNKQHRKRVVTQMQHNQVSKQKKLPRGQSQGLFTDLQVILDDRVRPGHQRTKEEEERLRGLSDKLNRFKKDKQCSHSFQQHTRIASEQLVIFQQPNDMLSQSNFSELKLKNNFSQWDKLDLSLASQKSYRKSSFEDELSKIQYLTDRSDASLQKYFVMKEQLLKIGFQLQTAHNKKK